MESFWLAWFCTQEDASRFLSEQATHICDVSMEDCQKLHPDIRDARPFLVRYRLKTPMPLMRSWALDANGNMLPNSLYE
jgi:hypothetical protein